MATKQKRTVAKRSLSQQLIVVNGLLNNWIEHGVPHSQNVASVDFYSDYEEEGVGIHGFLCCNEDAPYSEEFILENVVAFGELLKKHGERALKELKKSVRAK